MELIICGHNVYQMELRLGRRNKTRSDILSFSCKMCGLLLCNLNFTAFFKTPHNCHRFLIEKPIRHRLIKKFYSFYEPDIFLSSHKVFAFPYVSQTNLLYLSHAISVHLIWHGQPVWPMKDNFHFSSTITLTIRYNLFKLKASHFCSLHDMVAIQLIPLGLQTLFIHRSVQNIKEIYYLRSKIPSKNHVRQRYAEGFNSGVKGLKVITHSKNIWQINVAGNQQFSIFNNAIHNYPKKLKAQTQTSRKFEDTSGFWF
jgi:hypothetical protein